MIEATSQTENPISDHTEIIEAVDVADLAVEFERSRDRLRRMAAQLLNPCLSTRVDPSDILQDAFIRANADLENYQANGGSSLSSWLRFQTRFAVGDCHRRHLNTQKRDARQENQGFGTFSTDGLDQLAESLISPSSAIARDELSLRIRTAIERMPEIDREILILRHLDEVSIVDAAAAINISVEAAKKRHLRAIRRLRGFCEGMNSESKEEVS